MTSIQELLPKYIVGRPVVKISEAIDYGLPGYTKDSFKQWLNEVLDVIEPMGYEYVSCAIQEQISKSIFFGEDRVYTYQDPLIISSDKLESYKKTMLNQSRGMGATIGVSQEDFDSLLMKSFDYPLQPIRDYALRVLVSVLIFLTAPEMKSVIEEAKEDANSLLLAIMLESKKLKHRLNLKRQTPFLASLDLAVEVLERRGSDSSKLLEAKDKVYHREWKTNARTSKDKIPSLPIVKIGKDGYITSIRSYEQEQSF